jgi:putative ABC transport system ATP-binding protein
MSGVTDSRALDDVNLHVDDSAFVVVLGASGWGKTMLLNLIGALDAASRAERTRIRRGTVSCIFQSGQLARR